MTNTLSYVLSVGSSFYITNKYKITGLKIDLAIIVASIIVGDSLSIRLRNSISVDISIGMALAMNNCIEDETYKADVEGNVNIICREDDNCDMISSMWLANIYSKLWCESKYLGYLYDDAFFMDDDYFIYKEPNSKINAEANIERLSDIYYKYCIR